jgi:S-DNA-T family DNA segregation ATPase FtsK/SpoIIIE
MLNAIKSKLTKSTKVVENKQSLITFEVTDLNETLDTLLTSPLLGEGTFSLEAFSDSNGTVQSLVAPPYMRKHFRNESVKHFNWDDSVNFFTINLCKPDFLPLFLQSETNLIHDLHLFANEHTQIYTQLLLRKRNKQYADYLISCYEQYLRGIDFPAYSSKQRKKQQKLIKFVDKVSGMDSERSPVEEIEQKILETCFQFELRLIVNGECSFNEIESLIGEMDFFNELYLSKARNVDEYIRLVDDRQFDEIAKYQTVSVSEIKAMLGGEVIQREVEGFTSNVSNETVVKKGVFNLPIHLLPIGVKKDREIDQHLVDELPNALATAKAIRNNSVEIVDVELGATCQRITMKIPQDVVYTDISGRLQNIKTALGVEMSIIQGNEPNTITFLIPCSVREVLYLKELLQDERFMEFAKENPLPFICGVDMFNKPVYKCLTKAPHLLVSGATGSGKSVSVNSLLITLMLIKNPNELRILLIDPKKVEFVQYKGFSHVENIIIDMDEAIKSLDDLVMEMEKRYDAMSKVGARNIIAYNEKSKKKLPYIVCAIDEYNDLRMQYPDVEEYIERLGQKARTSGIHLIIATQRPDKEVMSGVIKTNFASRISFKLDNSNEYRTVFGTGIPYKNLLGMGDGVVKYVGQIEEFIRFQAPVISLNEKEEEFTFDNIRKFYKGEVFEELELGEVEKEEVIEEEPIDRLKRVIAKTGETRIKHLQQELKIRINLVQDLMYQLVEEGWLEKNEKNQYVLIASEEELSKWRSH